MTGSFRICRPPLIDSVLEMLCRAARAGERCPLNLEIALAHGYDSPAHGSRALAVLAAAGCIRIAVHAHNYRVVTILTGPDAGAATLRPAHGRPPYRIIGADPAPGAAPAVPAPLGNEGAVWTEAEIDRLVGLRCAGADWVEIARRLGRSPDSVRAMARRRGLTPPRRVRDERPLATRRSCLTCTRPFDSVGRHNRLCPACRDRASRTPPDFSLAL